MFGRKKKKDMSLPDLPGNLETSPDISDYRNPPPLEDYHNLPTGSNTNNEDINSIPSFPDSPMKRGFNQAAIKDAVDTENRNSDPNLPTFHEPLPENHPDYKLIEMEEWKPHTEETNIPNEEFRPAPLMHDENPLPDESEMYHENMHSPPINKLEEGHPPHFSQQTQNQTYSQKIGQGRQVFVKLNKFQSARDSLTTIQEKLTDIDELLKGIRKVKAEEDEEIILWEKEMEAIKNRVKIINSEIFDTAYIC